ncbi:MULTISPECIES: hypothetical protein [Streptomyces]|uniref:Uncharacterized protein n=1 Tax=Streptomyces sp. NBC_00093 TaxID=2975649 RepID=A0AAU2AG07_9ACTN
MGGAELGLWTLTVDTVRDVEVDEVFVVRLHAGERTEWEVRSALRKVYVTAG